MSTAKNSKFATINVFLQLNVITLNELAIGLFYILLTVFQFFTLIMFLFLTLGLKTSLIYGVTNTKFILIDLMGKIVVKCKIYKQQ